MPLTPAPYYTSCSPIIAGCYLYRFSDYTGPVLPGYYSDGVNTYIVSGNLGKVDSVAQCSTTPPTSQCDDANWCCFVGNTLISLKDGSQKSIKNIQPGDEVLSFNESSNEIEIDKVVLKKGKITDDLVRYILTNGVILESTKDHPYYVNGLKISSFDPVATTDNYDFEIDVDLIKVGDVVNLEDGSKTIIEHIEVLDSSEQVYTLEIEKNHNYYANGVLVHNKVVPTICCTDSTGVQRWVSQRDCCCLGPTWAPCI